MNTQWMRERNKLKLSTVTPIFGQLMPQDRYILLLSYLHFANNEEQPATNGRAFKIKPVVDHLKKKTCIPSKTFD